VNTPYTITAEAQAYIAAAMEVAAGLALRK
jgi:hypothetical protein